MSKLRIPVAVAASVIALTHASASFADDTTTSTTTMQPATAQPAATTQSTTTTQPTTTVQQPAQPAPVVVQQQPAATTTTTAAPYNPTGASADSAEKSIERRPNRTLLSTGIGIFLVSYGASAVAGAISDRDADKNLFVPVVGPWMNLADRGCDSRGCGNNEDINKAMIVTSGIVQGAGVLMAISSLIIPESTTVTEKRTSAKAKVNVTPVSFGAGAGIGAVGRF